MLVSSVDKDRLFRGHGCSVVITDCDEIKGKKLSSLNHYWNSTVACHHNLKKGLNRISVQTNRYGVNWINDMMSKIITLHNTPHNESISYSFKYKYKDEHNHNIEVEFYVSDYGWSYISFTTDYLDCYEFYSSHRRHINLIKESRLNQCVINELIKENQEEFIYEGHHFKDTLFDQTVYKVECSIKPQGLGDVLGSNDIFKLKRIG